MNNTPIADRVRELEARVGALEARPAAPEIPPLPQAPLRHHAAVLLLVLVLMPAHRFGWARLAAWAERLGVRVMQRGIKVAARRGSAAQRAHAARVFGGANV